MAAVFRPVETVADAERASALFDEIWRAEMVLPAEIIRAIAFAGGYAVLALDAGRAVAGSVAFVGIVRPNVRTEPEVRRVGEFDCLGHAVDPIQRRDGSEHLFIEHAHL